MTERKKPASPNQTFFFEQGGRMRLSTSIQSMPFGELVENFLSERSFWRESKKGDWLLYDVRNFRLIPFDREGKQLGRELDIGDHDQHGKFSGVIAIFDVGLLPSNSENTKNSLINAKYFLKKEASVFILEAKYINQDRQWRKQLLHDIGLVKGNVLVSQEGYLIWEGRFPKEHKDKKGVDLTNPNDPNRYRRMQKFWRDMVDDYKRKGFVVISNEPLLSRLKNSKYIPQDISYLKEGLGITIQARCGCEWEVPFKHEWNRILHCPDEDCDGIPTNPNVVYDINGYNRITSKCFDCSDEGTYKQVIYRIEKRFSNGKAKLQEITFCPHCGIGNGLRRFLIVPQDQLKF